MRKLRPSVLLISLGAFMLEFPTPDRLDQGGGSLFRQANAVVGVPVSPGSASGVRRRTRRRTAVVAGSASASKATAAEANPAPNSAGQAPAAAASPAPKSVVPALPAGCGALQNNVYNCGGVIYKPYFQGDQVIYVVQ